MGVDDDAMNSVMDVVEAAPAAAAATAAAGPSGGSNVSEAANPKNPRLRDGGESGGGGGGGLCDEKTVEYLRDLIAEKQSILAGGGGRKQAVADPKDAAASGGGVEPSAVAARPKNNVVLRLLDQGKTHIYWDLTMLLVLAILKGKWLVDWVNTEYPILILKRVVYSGPNMHFPNLYSTWSGAIYSFRWRFSSIISPRAEIVQLNVIATGIKSVDN